MYFLFMMVGITTLNDTKERLHQLFLECENALRRSNSAATDAQVDLPQAMPPLWEEENNNNTGITTVNNAQTKQQQGEQ